MQQEPLIGVIGGMGPYAGLDLVRKIFDLTQASKDQDHLPVALLSLPHRIPDRSTFLMNPDKPSPVPALVELAVRLDQLGVTVAGIPCNTAHAPPIFDAIRSQLRAGGHQIRLLHMIEEAVHFVREQVTQVQRIGVLSTLAVYRMRVYAGTIESAGLVPVLPDVHVQEELINRSIFDQTFGIKAQANPVTAQARENLLDAIEHLRQKGAEAVILGCTELPLAIPEREIGGILIVDPTEILARALIRESFPEKLRHTVWATE